MMTSSGYEPYKSLVKLVQAARGLEAAEFYNAAMLEQYCSSRQSTVNLLTEMPIESWWRTAQHEEFGSVTILQQA